MNEVYMETDRVRDMAQAFCTFADVLRAVSKALEVLINTLRTTAFIGLVGGAAFERYLSIIKPKIDYLAEYCEELCHDLDQAVIHFENGDQEGASRFY